MVLRHGGVEPWAHAPSGPWLNPPNYDEAQLRFYIGLAASAGLLTLDGAARRWQVTADAWRATDRPGQWAALVRAWLSSSPQPSTPSTTATMPLAPTNPLRSAASWRRNVILALSQLPDPPTPASLQSFLSWRYPRQCANLTSQLPGILAELEILGITGAGALSGPGRSAADADWKDASACVRALLPAPIEHFVLQGDLTAIAPGFLTPAVSTQLQLMAVPEGRGTAGIFRFSQASLEAAIGAGMAPDGILDFLQGHCSTTVPQSLGYLIKAAARAAAAKGSHPATTGLPATPHRVLPSKALPAGVVPPEPLPAEILRAEAEAQIAQLRRQPIWAEADGGESGTALLMEQLRAAIADGSQLRLQTVDGTGTLKRMVIQPLSLAAGTLRVKLPGAGHERRLGIHRILAAEAVANAAEPAEPTEELDG